MNEINQKSVINPSSGLIGRNPTHQEIAGYAENQSDIVKAIKNSGVKRMQLDYDYTNIDKTNPPPLMGITKIREMTEESAIKLCQNLMRSRPSIFKVHIKLGDYPSSQRLSGQKIRMLDSTRPRFHTEIGEKIGSVLADKYLHVTEIIYSINNANTGQFNATAEVFGTTEEEYNNDDLFKPAISFEFIKTT